MKTPQKRPETSRMAVIGRDSASDAPQTSARRCIGRFEGASKAPKTGFSTKPEKSTPQNRYWTLWRGDDAAARTAYGMPPRDTPEFPHEGICSFGFLTPGELMADLLTKNWSKDPFDHAPNRFALVQITPAGLNVTAFDTYAAAVKAHKDGEDPEKLKPCPFCGRRDKLVMIDWTHERPDGTEYNGDAVKCDRCDAIAPLAVFQTRTK